MRRRFDARVTVQDGGASPGRVSDTNVRVLVWAGVHGEGPGPLILPVARSAPTDLPPRGTRRAAERGPESSEQPGRPIHMGVEAFPTPGYV